MASITVQTPYNEYTGNGSSTVYAYTFLLLAAADLVVKINGTATTAYTLSGVGVSSGGNVTFTTAPASGATVLISREIPLSRSIEYQTNGDFRASTVNLDFNRLWQYLQLSNARQGGTLRAPYPEQLDDCPAESDRLDRFLTFDATTGQPEASSVTLTQVASAVAAAYSGADGPLDALSFVQAGTGAVTLTAQAKARQIVNIKDFGASSSNTDAQNKTALQTAITALNVAGGGVIMVDYDTPYGRATRTASTWPSFTGTTVPIMVIDYSEGATQSPSVYPTSYDGAQAIIWTNTPQTTSPGQHDGNTQWLRASWAPAFCVSNDSNLAAAGHASRTANDNRRAWYAVMVDGAATWQVGQGTRVGAALTNEELSNFAIQKLELTGDTLGDYTPYNVERMTGNISYGGGRNIPNAHHHFEAVTGSPSLDIAMFESKGTTCTVVLRNSNGSGDDVSVLNSSGSLGLTIPAQGRALTVKKANTYIGIGDADPSYRLDLAETRASSYINRIRNTSATNGSVAEWYSSSASSGGWSFVDMYSSGGGDREFSISGNGSGYCDGSWVGGGADRAEMFEWADGNPDGFDGDKKEVGSNRAGVTVTIDGGKIRPAKPGDTVLGVVSVTYDSLGNANPLNWGKKYLADDLGCPILESYEIFEWDERVLIRAANEKQTAIWETVKHSYPHDGIPEGVQVPETATRTPANRPKRNPAYNPKSPYTPRHERKEWDAVGILGICRVKKGQPTNPAWVKLRDISATVEEWLVK